MCARLLTPVVDGGAVCVRRTLDTKNIHLRLGCPDGDYKRTPTRVERSVGRKSCESRKSSPPAKQTKIRTIITHVTMVKVLKRSPTKSGRDKICSGEIADDEYKSDRSADRRISRARVPLLIVFCRLSRRRRRCPSIVMLLKLLLLAALASLVAAQWGAPRHIDHAAPITMAEAYGFGPQRYGNTATKKKLEPTAFKRPKARH